MKERFEIDFGIWRGTTLVKTLRITQELDTELSSGKEYSGSKQRMGISYSWKIEQ